MSTKAAPPCQATQQPCMACAKCVQPWRAQSGMAVLGRPRPKQSTALIAPMIPDALRFDRFSPGRGCEGADAVWRIHEPGPGGAAAIGDDVAGIEHAVAERVGAQALSDGFDRVQLRAVGGRRSRLMLPGTCRRPPVLGQPAPLQTSRAWAPGVTWRLIPARGRVMAWVLA